MYADTAEVATLLRQRQGRTQACTCTHMDEGRAPCPRVITLPWLLDLPHLCSWVRERTRKSRTGAVSSGSTRPPPPPPPLYSHTRTPSPGHTYVKSVLPRSASACVRYGPARTRDRSKMRTPRKGCNPRNIPLSVCLGGEIPLSLSGICSHGQAGDRDQRRTLPSPR